VAEPGGAPDRPLALPPRTRLILAAILVVLAGLSLNLYGRTPARPVVEFSGYALGTTWSVKLAEPSLSGAARQRVSEAITSELERVDALMSTWRDDSQIMRFNQSLDAAPMLLAAETTTVLAVAQDVAAASGGALDVTVEPLVEAWGFGRATRPEPPAPSDLRRLREDVGWWHLRLDEPARTLAKDRAGVRVDLSAVAKGFAVDEIARALEALGYPNGLVEVGGELRAAGGHRDGGPWRVAIETPDAEGRAIHRIVALRDRSMATSGDYRNYYEHEGRRLSHLLDPRTGRPVEHALASVTVLHPEALLADAWATALQVLGLEAGYALAVEEGLAAYFIVRRGQGFESRPTAGFEPFLVPEERAP